MSGKIIGVMIIVVTAAFAIGVYYAQVYGYYDDVVAVGGDVQLTTLRSGAPEEILFEDFQAIDAESSPIRYRACFTTSQSQAMLTETYEIFEDAEPRNAPYWFECFDAEAIGAALVSGEAIAFVSQRNIEYGIDRVAAIFADGRGYVWHQINDCGDTLYDGSAASDDCPPREVD